jgi:hypothetical protein
MTKLLTVAALVAPGDAGNAKESLACAHKNLGAYDYAPGAPAGDKTLERVVNVVQVVEAILLRRR